MVYEIDSHGSQRGGSLVRAVVLVVVGEAFLQRMWWAGGGVAKGDY